ncbi:MAG: NifB/NifX family molybdenum-iron cluster-binding protein [Deltaproteobacteria bacterium]|jgi:predicted Fe-Mo cluster-binding NifX family protein
MKIVFASEDNQGLKGSLSAHFGRCPFYTIVNVEDKAVSNVQVIDNPYFSNHVPGAVPQFINEQGAQVMIAGGMGPRALELFNQFGIEAITTGMHGSLENILNAYLRGEISGATGCEHHHE